MFLTSRSVRIPLCTALIAATLLVYGCGPLIVTREQTQDPRRIDREVPYLKAHTADGALYVLHNWSADSTHIRGNGVLLDANRDTIKQGAFDVPSSSIALFETDATSRGLSTTGWALIGEVLFLATLDFVAFSTSGSHSSYFGSHF